MPLRPFTFSVKAGEKLRSPSNEPEPAAWETEVMGSKLLYKTVSFLSYILGCRRRSSLMAVRKPTVRKPTVRKPTTIGGGKEVDNGGDNKANNKKERN